jgi:predicted chitinase
MNPTQAQIGVILAIENECIEQGLDLRAQIAYVLATVEHETGNTFLPVVESYWLKNPDEWCKKHHPEYYPYYGRGYVQLTWPANYVKYGKLLDVGLLNNPDLALEPEIARFILVHGFKHGAFTGKKLEDYVNEHKVQFLAARRCINGSDQAGHIASLAFGWESWLKREISHVR